MTLREIIRVDEGSDSSKFRQIVDSVTEAISNGSLKHGDSLPSINQVINEFGLSRDTIFKAYGVLKSRGVVKSVQNKGYFVCTAEKKVLLLLDTMKAYKEVLYGEFHKALPSNYSYSVQFHHYDIDIFNNFMREANGKYSKYIVMPFKDPGVRSVLGEIPKEKLLILDWKINESKGANLLYQDFGEALYNCLTEADEFIGKYEEFIFLYPEFTKHPHDSVDYFNKYCKERKMHYSVQYDSEELNLQKGQAYICVSDRMLGRALEQAKQKGLVFGKDVGFISYNETPMKQFIDDGITVVSTDFKLLGQKAAEFVGGNETMEYKVPTKLLLRKSL